MAGPKFFEVEFEDSYHNMKSDLLKVKNNAITELDKIVLKGAFMLQRAVQKKIKEKGLVDTGYLKANWVSFVRYKALTEVVGVVATNTHYASYLEYGTTDDEDNTIIEARKFMEEAWNENGDKIMKYIMLEWGKVVGNA